MTIQNVQSPENTLSSNDPGDDTQLRYRYQAGYAALVSLGLLDDFPEYEEIFCEHHEDTLVKQNDGKFIGVQVKTKEIGQEPFKSNDDQIINTIKRFVEQYVNFPGYYIRFVIATNYGFWANEKENTKNLHRMLEIAKQSKSSPTARLHRELKKYLNLIADRVNNGGEVSAPVTTDQVLDVLCLIELQEDLPKFEDLETRIARSIQQHYDIGDAGYDDLLRAAKALLFKAFEAASLEHLSPKQAYFSLCKDPSQERLNAVIQGKRITREVIASILSTNLSPIIFFRTTNSVSISDLPNGMDVLELKMASGDISADNIALMKDQKYSTEYLLAQWLAKYGAARADQQFTHVSSIVRNESLEARDETSEVGKPFGTRMLVEIRRRLRERFSNNPGQFLGCQYEHLLGTTGILTEMCDIWWSDKFQLPGEI